jgi:hypothetical protein
VLPETVVVVVGLLVTFLPLAIVGVVVAVMVGRGRRPPTGPPPGPLPPAADPGGTVAFHARALRPGQDVSPRHQLDDGTYGRLTVTPTDLWWHPDAGAPWSAPLSAVTVRGTNGVMTFGQPSVDVDIAGSGPWRLVVSTRPINRVVSNDVKRFGEARTAREVAALLAGRAGPRPAP